MRSVIGDGRVESNGARSLDDRQRSIADAIGHAAHLLPAQGPITTFVHHNTLHAFEGLPFEEALDRAAATFGCHPYLREERYREELDSGRIQIGDLADVLRCDLLDRADENIAGLTTRYELRFAMLRFPLRSGNDAELRWLIDEADALRTFSTDIPTATRQLLRKGTRNWLASTIVDDDDGLNQLAETLKLRMRSGTLDQSDDASWDAPTLEVLWRLCHRGVELVPPMTGPQKPAIRLRDIVRSLTNEDSDALVNDVLIRFCAAFLDQGIARWRLPERDAGFWNAFLALYQNGKPVESWMTDLPAELRRIASAKLSPMDSICESLDMIGITESQLPQFIEETLLALRGWAGMIWQMETNAEWTQYPAPRGTLEAYLAVRLILERLALKHIAKKAKLNTPLRELCHQFSGTGHDATSVGKSLCAFHLFQLAQHLEWTADKLARISVGDWATIIQEMAQFSSRERRRVFHLAYERRYRDQALNAVSSHIRDQAQSRTHTSESRARPAYQVVCCIDEREESFRRHLEEIAPACETFGFAGFFGVAMYYRGVTEARFHPLCPVVVKPKHYIQEDPLSTFEDASRHQAETRRRIGRAAHRVHLGSRTFIGGLFTSLFGAIATMPLVMRILFPRAAARWMHRFGAIVRPGATRLRVERIEDEPGSSEGHIGYSVPEMTGIVGNVLRAMGLTRNIAQLVMFVGHGSSSMNNPHAAAYDCGACGGGCGGPNARAFAQMANDPRVRQRLAAEGLAIPDDTHFVGCSHNTCDDGLTYYDLDRVPVNLREAFSSARNDLHEASRRNAHERCRRFASADFPQSFEAALRHVEGRSADLSQVRPECGHATNALCFVGRRAWSRGLFLDRRAFLTSYDPTTDDERASLLGGLLNAVVPVCAGINLEYFFSYVDSNGYGCGTKLPHNITSLLGVMDGPLSDLRPGLPWQMVEIHDPVRILFLIETAPATLTRILDSAPSIAQLVRHRWVQLATLDPNDASIHLFQNDRFVPLDSSDAPLPTATSSTAWYDGKREHLPFARIAGSHAARRSTEKLR
ncbi:MAG: DUF2309 domain-containing protein [Phycisphaerales bacterium]|nr:DUF2309 domain-containing protein [Phycisphaerales bacterium]MCB9858590.1 DUF2309 domain-containing protein [Phycisphaerales bacterium]